GAGRSAEHERVPVQRDGATRDLQQRADARQRGIRVTVRDQRELVAVETVERFLAERGDLQARGDLHERQVAALVALRVVDRGEAVEAQHGDGKRLAGGQARLHALHEGELVA